MCPRDLDAWQQALDLAEDDLRERERRALGEQSTPAELRALADERDRLADERDGLAAAYDEQAEQRDDAGLGRDVRSSSRDRAARERNIDTELASLDRFMSGTDRDLAAGDRADALDNRRRATRDRAAASEDRHRAADDRSAAAKQADTAQLEISTLHDVLNGRAQIGQAEGLLMARYRLSPAAAFRLLVKLSQEQQIELRELAARLIADAERDAEPDELGRTTV
jgi:hypothetical protein